MSEADEHRPGSILWVDLTVKDADAVRQFYQEVVGWTPEPVDVGGYDDYNMLPAPGAEPAAGICFARGVNADLPPQWLIYITTPDVDAAAERCRKAGGKVLHGPRQMGEGLFCVIQDPAGAVAALYAPKPPQNK